MNDFESIKLSTDITSFITSQAGGEVKKTGGSISLNPCPFCNHKDCFKIFPGTKSYKCFSCGQSGDMFRFVADYFKIADRYQVLLKASELTGIALTNSHEVKERSAADSARETIFNRAAEIYNVELLAQPKALDILKETRDYSPKEVKKYRVGFSGMTRNLLYNALKDSFDHDAMLASGLFVERDGKLFDFFAPKMFIFPHIMGKQVHDFSSKDALKHKKKTSIIPPYRLKAEYRIPNAFFYNQDAIYYDPVYIVEGQHDAIQFMRRSGNNNALALTGNPSDDAIKYLIKYAKGKKIYLALDQDEGGLKTSKKLIEELITKCGFLRIFVWDDQYKDIDEYLRHHPEDDAIQHLDDSAVNALQYYVSNIPPSDDIQVLVRAVEPIKKKLLQDDDIILIETLLSYVCKYLTEGKTVARIIKKQLEKERRESLDQQAYIDNIPFYEGEGVYWHKMSKGSVPISNFCIRIKDKINQDNRLYYLCDLKSVTGELVEDVSFSPEQRVDARKFRVAVQAIGDFHFTGRDHELSGIWQYEQMRSDVKTIYLIKRYGYIRERNLWLFDNCAIADDVYPADEETGFIHLDNHRIKSEDVFVYQYARPKINIKTVYSSDFTQEVAEKFHIMLDSSASGRLDTFMGYLFLAFVPATIYGDDIFKAYNLFPFLISYGPPRTGKSTATGLLMSFFGLINSREDFTETSGPGISQIMSQLGLIPYWLDEFRNGPHFEKIKGTIKNIYNRVGSGKGGLDDKRTIREVFTSLWLSGEHIPSDEAVVSRSIVFRFKPLNAKKNRAFDWLTKHQRQFSAITRQLILNRSEEQAHILLRQIDTYKEFLQGKGVDPRTAINYAILAGAIQLYDFPVPDGFDDYIIAHALESLRYSQEESVSMVFFRELNSAYARGLLNGRYLSFRAMDSELAIRFEPVMSILQSEARKSGHDFRFKGTEVLDYLKDIPGFIIPTGKSGLRRYFRIGDKSVQKNCIAFDCQLLPEGITKLIADIIDEFSKEE